MPAFLTRSSFGQPQPSVASLPFSQFGGERPILPQDTTGGLPFPDAGIPQPEPESPFDFLSPTGLSREELQALLSGLKGRRFGRIGTLGGTGEPFSNPFLTNLSPQLAPQPAPTTSSQPIAFEGGMSTKFNPIGAGGLPLPKLGP